MKHFLDRITFFGGLLLAGYVGWGRAKIGRWNASDSEVLERQPGDDVVARPLMSTTRSVTIQAPPERVWQWLVQIGYGRGGFYSYDVLERAAGLAGLRSAQTIEPELQKLKAGDTVAISPVTPMTVAVLKRARALVLHICMSPFSAEPVEKNAGQAWMDWSWAFLITPQEDGSCRLTSRVRANYGPYLMLWPLIVLLVEPVSFVMDHKLLLTVKERAEGSI